MHQPEYFKSIGFRPSLESEVPSIVSTALQFTESVQDGIVKAVETSQRWTLDALKAATSSLDPVLPDRSTLPFAGDMPSVQEAIDSSFRFTERLLEAQRSFVSELAGLGTPAPSTPAKKSTAA